MATRSGYAAVYKVDEVARMFKLTTRDVMSLIRNGDLPAIRLGRYYRVPKSVIDGLFAQSVKQNFTPEDLGLGILKARRETRDSVAYVNRIRARNKKSLKETVAELDKWRFD